MNNEPINLELERHEAVELVGLCQVEKNRQRNQGDDTTADWLGDLQGRLIERMEANNE